MKSAGKRSILRFTCWFSALVGNPVEICQVGVKHDALSPEDEDPALYRIMTLEFHDSDSCARSRQTWSQSVTTCFRVHARELSFLLD